MSTDTLTNLAARLYLADPDRPGPGPWESLPEGHQRPYLSMAQAALDFTRVGPAHSCPYPASGCTAPNCNVSAARAEQRAYERGHVDGFNKALGKYARG